MTTESTHAAGDTPIADKLWLKVLIGLIAGVVVGILLGPDFNLVSRESVGFYSAWLALPGQLFLRLILFIVLPLVLSSVALSFTGGQEQKAIKKLGGSVVVYFLTTKTLSVTLALVITAILQPGTLIDTSSISIPDDIAAQARAALGGGGDVSVPQAIVNIFPQNFFDSLANADFLGVVIAAVIFGLALISIPAIKSKPLIDLLNSVQTASIRIVTWIMNFAPYAVFGLLASALSSMGLSALQGLGAYIGTFMVVMLAIFTMYMIILTVLAKRNPVEFVRDIREVMVIAFSTSSSSATMPVTLKTAETKLHISANVRRLVIPLGTTVNMDGTAAYQGVVVMFLAQAFGIDLGIQEIVTVMALSIGASIGAAGIPGGSIAILTGILLSIGIPGEGIALVLAVDRLLDMIRTANNVTGDLVASATLAKLLGYAPEPVQDEASDPSENRLAETHPE